MTAPIIRQSQLLIVLVEDNPRQRKKMKELLAESFPQCEIKTIAHGIEAMNYLLTPVNKYHLVILDGKLDTFPKRVITQVNGPDVAAAMNEKNIKVPVVLWTNDPKMLASFDEVYGKRLPEIEKPCRKNNIEAVLAPIIEKIESNRALEEYELSISNDESYQI
jgi:DNA-binding NtrC family response regulator